MRLLIAILVLLLTFSVVQGERIIGSPSALPVDPNLKVWKVDIQADTNGNFSEQTGDKIIGELHSIAYENGNFTGNGTIFINSSVPSGWTIDSYNISSGNALRFPGGLVYGSADYYVPYYLFSKLWINMTSQQANGSATIYLLWG